MEETSKRALVESVYLDDIEKEKITHFLNDSILKEAVRKVFLKRVYTDGVLSPGKPTNPYENFFLNIYEDAMGKQLSDEQLGQITRARRFAIELIQRGFQDLESFKKVAIVPERVDNKHR